MTQQDTTEQLQALRAQLQQIEQERAAHDRQATAAAPRPSESSAATQALPPELASWLGENGDIDAQEILDNLKAGIGLWLEGFDEDLKNTRPSTLLLVFGLGVMVGKMTA